MKRVIIISSSPRNASNSDLLCEEFMRGVQAAEHTVEKISLKDCAINYCRACNACQKTEKCVIQDDLTALHSRLLAADVIVLASPVYFYTVNAQMKTFIDRLAPIYTKLQNKKFYFIVTAADNSIPMMQRTIECFRGLTEGCLTGAKEAGIIYGVGLWESGAVLQQPELLQKAYELGKNV